MEKPTKRTDDRSYDDEPDEVHGQWIPARRGRKPQVPLGSAEDFRPFGLELLVGEDSRLVEVAELAEVRLRVVGGMRVLRLPHQVLHLLPSLGEAVDTDPLVGKLQGIRTGEWPLLHEAAVGNHE